MQVNRDYKLPNTGLFVSSRRLEAFSSLDEIYNFVEVELKQKVDKFVKQMSGTDAEKILIDICGDINYAEECFRKLSSGERGEKGYLLFTSACLVTNKILNNPRLIDQKDPELDFAKKTGYVLHPLLFDAHLDKGNNKLFISMSDCLNFDHSLSNLLVPIKQIKRLSSSSEGMLKTIFADDFDPQVDRFSKFVEVSLNALDSSNTWEAEGISRNIAIIVDDLCDSEDEKQFSATHEISHLILLNNYSPIKLHPGKNDIFSTFLYQYLTIKLLTNLIVKNELHHVSGHTNPGKFIRENADLLFHEFVAMSFDMKSRPMYAIPALLSSRNPYYVLSKAFIFSSMRDYDRERSNRGNILSKVESGRRSIKQILMEEPGFVKYCQDYYLNCAKGFYDNFKKGQ